jgi:hypothetical protein
MTSMIESSLVVRALRRVAQNSLGVALFRVIGRRWEGIGDALGRAAADRNRAPDRGGFADVARDSRVVKAIDRLISVPSAAWDGSRVRPWFESSRAGVLALPPSQRVRLIGWMLVVGVVTRAAMYLVSGATLTDTTLAIWAVVAGLGAFMMTASRSVAAAWDDWKQRRLR